MNQSRKAHNWKPCRTASKIDQQLRSDLDPCFVTSLLLLIIALSRSATPISNTALFCSIVPFNSYVGGLLLSISGLPLFSIPANLLHRRSSAVSYCCIGAILTPVTFRVQLPALSPFAQSVITPLGYRSAVPPYCCSVV